MKIRIRRLLTTMVACAVAFAVWPAQLTVRNFMALPTDQTAINRETRRTDQNGKNAALIKIYTNLNPAETYFDNGVMGIVAQESKPGQIWLYIPQRSQKLKITNSRHEPVDFFFPEEMAAGKTYSMMLSVKGREVTLTASVNRAPIWVDGDSLGLSPQNLYLPYGDHHVKAEKGSMLYEGVITVSEDGPSRFELPMEDENRKYSEVTVKVPGNAGIWFQGENVGRGEWHARLLGGQYSVELRKEGFVTKTERFTAVAGQPTAVDISALAPLTGMLDITVLPQGNARIMHGDSVMAVNRLETRLPVGRYTYNFEKKGYISQSRTFAVRADESTVDTVAMQRVQYIRPNSLFFGAGFTYANQMGVSAHLGVTVHNVMLEGGYTLGLGKSDELYWFNNQTDFFDGKCTYTVDEAYLKLGYQFSVVQRLGFTPQVGWLGQRLRSGTHGNGAMCHNLSVGLRCLFNPAPTIGVFVTPEYAVPVKVNQLYDDIAARSNITKGGFQVTAGISFNIRL